MLARIKKLSSSGSIDDLYDQINAAYCRMRQSVAGEFPLLAAV